MNKKIGIIFVGLIIILGFLFFKNKLLPKASSIATQPPSQTNPAIDQKPQIVSTKPDPLNEAIVPADQIIEISFNRPLENVGEFKVRIEPEIEFKKELSSDRKTSKIKPAKPFELGLTFTLFIGPETKFDGVGRWGEEKVYHFKTIKYRGI